MPRIKISDGVSTFSLFIESDGGLSLETLKSIVPGATNLINPAYEEEKVFLSIANSKIFNPDGWDTSIVYLAHFGLRPVTPIDQALRSNSPDWQRSVTSFLLETEQGCCVTVLAKRAALTCAHCLDDSITIGSNIVVKPCKGNIMTTFPNGQSFTVVKVAYINKYTDFIFLLSEIDLCNDPPLPVNAEFGETYVLIGLSAMDREYTKLENLKITMVNGPLCVKRGIVSSKVMDKYNKHMGDSGMKKGDSGGGLYNLSGHFIGMAVEFDSKRTDGISMCHFNPATFMLGEIQNQGYSLFYLNNFEANTYPEKEDLSPARDRGR